MIRKILVPLDLTSVEPARLAIKLAGVFPHELLFFHCLASSPLSSRLFFPGKNGDGHSQEASAEERRCVEGKIAGMVAALAEGGLSHSVRIAKGAVLHEILREVDTLHPDWIIQGRRTSLRREEWISGGISWGLMEKAPCPVITVMHAPPSSRLLFHPEAPPGCSTEAIAASPPRESASFGKIIFLTAFGESSIRALPHAAALAGKTGAELIILHLRADSPNRRMSADPQEQLPLLVERAKALQTDLTVSSALCVGSPEDFINHWIQPGTVDMLVMGMGLENSPGPFQRRFMELIFERSPCPVMTVNREGVSSRMEKRYRKIFQSLTPEDLLRISEEQPETIGEELFGSRQNFRTSELFLKYYSQAGLTRIFEEYGIFPLLRQKGFADPKVFLKLDDPFRQRLRICFDAREDEKHLLVEMVLHEDILEAERPKEGHGRGHYFPVLMVEWLLMQNPKAAFTLERPPLPGQRYPGLGLSREMLQLVSLIGLRIGKDGIAIHPQHFHAAVLYHWLFQCYNPIQEGQLCALLRDTEEFNLDDVSWAIELNCVRQERPEQKWSWHIENQIHPLTPLLKNHFHSESYREWFWESLAGHHYCIDWPLFEKRFHDRIRAGREFSTELNRSGGGSIRAAHNPGEFFPPKTG